MKLWILSDLHCEIAPFLLGNNAPQFDILIAAGDICTPLFRAIEIVAELANGRPAIFVAGNHEFYGFPTPFTMRDAIAKGKQRAKELGVYYLENESVGIDGALFIGATLWTDYRLYQNEAEGMNDAKRAMNDHRHIFPFDLGAPLSPQQCQKWHDESVKYLDTEMSKSFAGKRVIVTHHLPHRDCISPRFLGNFLNPAFCSDLDWLIRKQQPDIWVHGHTHSPVDVMVAQTRIVANPRGYFSKNYGTENKGFDEILVIGI
jgi:predicted phosphodiesterase